MTDLPSSLNRARAAALAAARDVGEHLSDAYRRATGSQASSEASRRGSPPGPGRNGAVLPAQPSAGVRLDRPALYAHERYLPAFSRERPRLDQERPRNVRQFSDVAWGLPSPIENFAHQGLIDAPAVTADVQATQQRYGIPDSAMADPTMNERVRGLATGEGAPTRYPGPLDAPPSVQPPQQFAPDVMRRRGAFEGRRWLNGQPGVRNPATLSDYLSGLGGHSMPTEALRRINHHNRMISTQGMLNMRPEGAIRPGYLNPGSAPEPNRSAYTPPIRRVNTPEEARALPPGTRYVTPDGQEYER